MVWTTHGHSVWSIHFSMHNASLLQCRWFEDMVWKLTYQALPRIHRYKFHMEMDAGGQLSISLLFHYQNTRLCRKASSFLIPGPLTSPVQSPCTQALCERCSRAIRRRVSQILGNIHEIFHKNVVRFLLKIFDHL